MLRMRDKNDSNIGSVAHVANEVTILRIPMDGSCAIPLELSSPEFVELLTWCFVDFDAEADLPSRCLLIVHCSKHVDFWHGSSITVRTHIVDRHIRLLEAPVPLSSREVVVLARAILAAIAPDTVHRLAALLPVLASVLDEICAASSSSCDCELIGSKDLRAPVVVGLDYVPTCLIVRLSGEYTYVVVEAVLMRVGPRITMTLTLASPLDLRCPGEAILVGGGRYSVARIAGIE